MAVRAVSDPPHKEKLESPIDPRILENIRSPLRPEQGKDSLALSDDPRPLQAEGDTVL